MWEILLLGDFHELPGGKKNQQKTIPSQLLKSCTVHHVVSRFLWCSTENCKSPGHLNWIINLQNVSMEGKKKVWFLVATSSLTISEPKTPPAIHEWGRLAVYPGVIMRWHGELHLDNVLALLNHRVHVHLGSSSFLVYFESDQISDLLW